MQDAVKNSRTGNLEGEEPSTGMFMISEDVNSGWRLRPDTDSDTDGFDLERRTGTGTIPITATITKTETGDCRMPPGGGHRKNAGPPEA